MKTLRWKATGKSYYTFCRSLVTNALSLDVRNVLVIVAISQKDPLNEFNA